MLSESNFESPKTPIPESDGEDKTITPNNLETPKVCKAPKKESRTLLSLCFLKTKLFLSASLSLLNFKASHILFYLSVYK